MKKRFVIVMNPAAGNCGMEHVEWVCKGLRSAGHEAEIKVSEFKGNCTELTKAALSAGADVVVAAGGDGTINEIAGTMAGSGVPMGIFPRGSVNILAREIGLKPSDQAVLDCLLNGTQQTISMGCIADARFLIMAGVGIDARAVAGVTEELKKKHGKRAYVRQLLAEMLHPPGTRFEIRTPEKTLDGASIIICNAKRYAGSFKMAPQASLQEPLLDVCVLNSGRPLSVIRYNLGLLLGIHPRFRDVTTWKTAEAEIRCLTDSPGEPVQADGDAAATVPCHIRVAANTLSILTPPSLSRS